ncbi:MAG: M24 family metallopeptidase [Nitrososphaerota archaeon]|nr:M24 family metallopeptidase [Nitrososphaerota archaeon]
MGIFGKRRERVLSLASKFDAVVVTNPKNLFYLTDFWGGGIGIVEGDSTTIVTSVMEEYRANETGKDVRVVPSKNMVTAYQTVAKKLKGKTLMDQYDPRLKGTVDDSVFLEARRQKDAEELRKISQASKKVDELYELLEQEIQVGRTEFEIAGEVMRLATTEGLSPLASEGSLSPIIVASGPNAALPHAELSGRKVRIGDMVVADIFFRFQGYCTDCTRTYAVGKVPEEWTAGYQAVFDAQAEGIKLVKRGVAAKDVHAGVSAVLKERGLEKYFTHGTGHGVGIDIHERPSIGATSTDILADGDVVTIEPGIYVPEEYGVRIEDTVTVGKEVKVLFDYTKELLVL